jgi:hypothetical protein
MLTKEIKVLNLVYKKYKGDRNDLYSIYDFIHRTLGVKDPHAFELAAMFHTYHSQSNGDFNNVPNLKKITREEHEKSIPLEIRISMRAMDDNDLAKYKIIKNQHGNATTVDYYKKNGTLNKEIYIFDDVNDIIEEAANHENTDDVCDPDGFGYWTRPFLRVTDNARHEYAERQSENEVSKMSDEQVFEILHTTDLINRYERGSKEYNELLEDLKKQLKDDMYDQINDELENEPSEYFIDQLGVYENEREFYLSFEGLEFDCPTYLRNYLGEIEFSSLVSYAGYDDYDTVQDEENNKKYYVLWHNL